MNHEVKKEVSQGLHRVIYHAHTPNVIALTFVLPLKDEIFTRELWEMATECPVVFPDGIGVVGWMVPGGRAGNRGGRGYDNAPPAAPRFRNDPV